MGSIMFMNINSKNYSKENMKNVNQTPFRDAPWLPGSEAPSHLDGSLQGDFGFDPLSLGKDPVALKWYRQAELQHARWAMLAITGILVQSIVRPEINFMS